MNNATKTNPLPFAVVSAENEGIFKQEIWTLEQLRDKLKTPFKTSETIEDYLAWKVSEDKTAKAKATKAKSKGGFVAGRFNPYDNKRKKENLLTRSAVNLDFDDCPADAISKIKAAAKYKSFLYSTHGHTPENPRLRLIIPLAKETSIDKWKFISKKLAEETGLKCDDVSFREVQQMYLPTVAKNGDFIFLELQDDLLDPDSFLVDYPDWKKQQAFFNQDEENKSAIKKQKDPRVKSGFIGAFCKAYTVREAIENFLSDVYEATIQADRFSYIPGSSSGGLIIYDGDLYAYSHHGTDPAGGRLCNAFDLVRIHLFGDQDDKNKKYNGDKNKPSFKAMTQFCLNDESTKAKILENDFNIDTEDKSEKTEWKGKLELTSKGAIKPSLRNFELIIKNDPAFKNLGLDDLTDRITIKGKLYWKQQGNSDTWSDHDDNSAQTYLANKYNIYNEKAFKTALDSFLVNYKKYNPLQERLEACPQWEGQIKTDNLFIDLFGAEDTPYTKAISRKFMAALVRRAFEPGYKFDHMLVLVGEPDLGKSLFFMLLAGEKYFSDSLSLTQMRDKTGAELLLGKWIVEVSELAGMRKADEEIVKGFISRSSDDFRAAYAARVTSHKRSCLLVGTTNAVEDGFLRDVTGNRKFWPIRVHKKLDFEKFNRSYIDQLFAHALTYYKNENLYLEGDLKVEATKVQADFLETDNRLGLIEQGLNKLLPLNWSDISLEYRQVFYGNTKNGLPQIIEDADCKVKRNKICVLEIWSEILGNDKQRLNRAESNKIIAMLQKLGWKQYAGSSSGKTTVKPYGKQKVFARPTNK